MSVIMELLKRFDLGFATSDYISGLLLAGRGMQSDDYELFSLSFLGGECMAAHATLA